MYMKHMKLLVNMIQEVWKAPIILDMKNIFAVH